jgi:hypothetical protein
MNYKIPKRKQLATRPPWRKVKKKVRVGVYSPLEKLGRTTIKALRASADWAKRVAAVSATLKTTIDELNQVLIETIEKQGDINDSKS